MIHVECAHNVDLAEAIGHIHQTNKERFPMWTLDYAPRLREVMAQLTAECECRGIHSPEAIWRFIDTQNWTRLEQMRAEEVHTT